MVEPNIDHKLTELKESIRTTLQTDDIETFDTLVTFLDDGNEEDVPLILEGAKDLIKKVPACEKGILEFLKFHPNAQKSEIKNFLEEQKSDSSHPAEEFFLKYGSDEKRLKIKKSEANKLIDEYYRLNPRMAFELYLKYKSNIVASKLNVPKTFLILEKIPEIDDLTMKVLDELNSRASFEDYNIPKIKQLYEVYLQNEKPIAEVEMNVPHIFRLIQRNLKVDDDTWLILKEIEIRLSSIFGNESKNNLAIENLNDRLLPKLYDQNEDILDAMIHQYQQESWLKYRKPKILALNKMELFQKMKQITSQLKTERIGLEEFNTVSFRFTREEEQEIVKEWLDPKLDLSKKSFKIFLPLYFNLIKRGEDWDELLKCANRTIEENKLDGEIGYFSKKFLFYLLFWNSDPELKIKISQQYGKYNPLPLVYPAWPDFEKETEPSYKINDSIVFNIENSMGIFSCGFGKGAAKSIGKSTFLNYTFYKNFEIRDPSPFSVNTIDIDLDLSFKPSRQICLADAHGKFESSKYLKPICCLFKVLIIHIMESDLKQGSLKEDLRNLLECVKISKINPRVILFIRDAEISSKETISSTKEEIIKQFNDLHQFEDYKNFEVHLLKDVCQLEGNSVDNLMTKIQKIILENVQQIESDLSFRKESFVEYFLKPFNLDESYTKVNNTIADIMEELKKYQNDFFHEKVFPCRILSQKYRDTVLRLRNTRDPEKSKAIKKEQENIENQRKSIKATPVIQKFVEMLKLDNSYETVLELSKKLRDFSQENTSDLTALLKKIKGGSANTTIKANSLKEDEEIKMIEEDSDMKPNHSKNEKNEEKGTSNQNAEPYNIYAEIEKRVISVEVLWRELVSVFTHNKVHVLEVLNFDPGKKIYEFLKKGEPFELVDGDNLEFCENTLNQVFGFFSDEKVAVVCILGPQSSGKSTLLNYLFGCQFASSVGRCTKGIYCSLLSTNHKYYKHMLVLDTEGLQGAEKGDDEFDKKITLFCLAISQIILVNVKGDIHLPMKRLLEICVLSLHELNKSRMSGVEVFFCFNQNPPGTKSAFALQIGGMVEEIIAVNKEAENVAKILPTAERDQNIKTLGYAFHKESYEKNPQKGIYRQWDRLHSISSFANDCSGLAKQIFECLTMKSTKFENEDEQDMYGNFREWAKMANDNWKTIDLFPAIYMYSEIKQIKQDKELEEYVNKFYEEETANSHLNVEEIFSKEESKLDSQKLRIEEIDKSLMEQISSHYNQKIENAITKLKRACDEQKYDPNLTKKHFNTLEARIEALKTEAKFNLRSKIQEENIKISQKKGFDDISQSISLKLNMLKSKGKMETDEALQAEFDKIWEEMTRKMLKELELEEMKRKLFYDLFSVYQGFRKLRTYERSELDFLLEETNPKKLAAHWKNNFIKPGYLKPDHTDQLCYSPLEIKLGEKNKFFSLSQFYSQKKVIRFFNPESILKKLNYDRIKNELLNTIQTIEKKTASSQAVSQKVDHILSKLSDFCITPNSEMKKIIKHKVESTYYVNSRRDDVESVLEQYGEVSDKPKKPMFYAIKIDGVKIIEQDPVWDRQFLKRDPFESLEIPDDYQPDDFKGCVIIKSKKLNYIPLPKFQEYNSALNYLINPLINGEKEGLHIRNQQLRELAIKYVVWDQFLESLFAAVDKVVSFKSDDSQKSDWKSVSRFSRELINNVIRKIIEIIEELNKDLRKIGFSLDMEGESHIDLISCIYCWKLLSDGIESSLKKPITEMESRKETWRSIYMSSILNNPIDISKSNSRSFHDQLYSALKKATLNHVSKQIKDYFTNESQHFKTLTMQQQLDDELLYDKGAKFEDVYNYINNQSRAIETHFQKEWDHRFAEQKRIHIGTYRTKIKKDLMQTLESYRMLVELFISKNLDKLNCKDFFSPKNMKDDYVLKSQNEKIFNKAGVKFFFDFLNGTLNKNWSCFIRYNDGKNEKEEEFTGNPSHFSIFEKKVFAKLEVSTFLRDFNHGDFEIPILCEFLQEGILIIEDKMKLTDKETGNWKEPELELDSIYNQLKNTALGCNCTCPTCGRKCDKDFQHTSKHSCELGHQIRGMKGIRRGEKSLSMATCDEIDPAEEFEIQDANGKRKIKWSEFMQKEGKDWQFKCLSEDNIIKNRVKYNTCWETYGRDFCKKFEEIYKTTIQFESKMQIENAHFIICLDGSGSMSGNRWQASVNGTAAFIEKLSSGKYLKPEKCEVSLIIFNHKVEKEIHCKKPDKSLCAGLEFPSGGTDFDAPLVAAISLIEKVQAKSDM